MSRELTACLLTREFVYQLVNQISSRHAKVYSKEAAVREFCVEIITEPRMYLGSLHEFSSLVIAPAVQKLISELVFPLVVYPRKIESTALESTEVYDGVYITGKIQPDRRKLTFCITANKE